MAMLEFISGEYEPLQVCLELFSKHNTENLFTVMIFDEIQVRLRVDQPAFAKLPLVPQGDPGGVLSFVTGILAPDTAAQEQSLPGPEMHKRDCEC